MKKSTAQKNRLTGVQAPEHPDTEASWAKGDESLQERLSRLEKELEETRMRADLYEEMINVAERKFDIQIIKKAGTKQ